MTELVALYDGRGRPSGTATRAEVRTRNLTHAATAVVVRDAWGRVHVHRRTDSKDVFPGLHDFAAGGVVDAGEDPAVAALRELEEELGVRGVELEPLRVARYTDDHTDYWAHCAMTTWDGPVRLQSEEVAWGDWWSTERLAAALDDPAWEFVPDTTALLGEWVRARAADRADVATQGWDSHAELVEGRWLDRTPHDPGTRPRLEVEARLMPRLAPRLPLAVPVPVVLDEERWRVRHRLVPGEPVVVDALGADDGARVGRFLRALHDSPAEVWTDTGIATDADQVAAIEEMGRDVVPLLPAELQETGRELVARCLAATRFEVLRHGDLGPEHLLATGGSITGVIDWTDVALGDPAVDLSWLVERTPTAFSRALVTAYGATDEELARGRDWNRLAPWWEVRHGLRGAGREYVESGLAGAVERLSR